MNYEKFLLNENIKFLFESKKEKYFEIEGSNKERYLLKKIKLNLNKNETDLIDEIKSLNNLSLKIIKSNKRNEYIYSIYDLIYKDEILNVVGEMFEKTLKDLIICDSYLDIELFKKMYQNVKDGLCYLHNLNICHTNLNNLNIIYLNNKFKISGLEEIKLYGSEEKRIDDFNNKYSGIEIYDKNSKVDLKKHDSFSFGMLLYEIIFTKTLPNLDNEYEKNDWYDLRDAEKLEKIMIMDNTRNKKRGFNRIIFSKIRSILLHILDIKEYRLNITKLPDENYINSSMESIHKLDKKIDINTIFFDSNNFVAVDTKNDIKLIKKLLNNYELNDIKNDIKNKIENNGFKINLDSDSPPILDIKLDSLDNLLYKKILDKILIINNDEIDYKKINNLKCCIEYYKRGCFYDFDCDSYYKDSKSYRVNLKINTEESLYEKMCKDKNLVDLFIFETFTSYLTRRYEDLFLAYNEHNRNENRNRNQQQPDKEENDKIKRKIESTLSNFFFNEICEIDNDFNKFKEKMKNYFQNNCIEGIKIFSDERVSFAFELVFILGIDFLIPITFYMCKEEYNALFLKDSLIYNREEFINYFKTIYNDKIENYKLRLEDQLDLFKSKYPDIIYDNTFGPILDNLASSLTNLIDNQAHLEILIPGEPIVTSMVHVDNSCISYPGYFIRKKRTNHFLINEIDVSIIYNIL